MIVDSSAIVAILKNEAEAQVFSNAIQAAGVVRMSAATYLEAHMVIGGYNNPVLRARLEEILNNPGIVIEPVTVDQAIIATDCHRSYGKGSGHPANLNFGDCFTYALARAKREPVLFKGEEFLQTDLRSALEHP
jgi:ribonuclease VapC